MNEKTTIHRLTSETLLKHLNIHFLYMISGCICKFRGQAPLPSHLLLFGTFEHLTEVEELKKLGSESSTQTDVDNHVDRRIENHKQVVDHTSDVYNQRNMEPFLTIAIVIMVICTRLDDLKKENNLCV